MVGWLNYCDIDFYTCMTLFISIPMLYGTDNIATECGELLRIFHEILSIPHNNVMDLNIVMYENPLQCHTYTTLIVCEIAHG